MKKYYSITIHMNVDLGEYLNMMNSQEKLACINITIAEANLENCGNNAYFKEISMKKRKNSESFFMDFLEIQHRFWFGEINDLLQFYKKQKVQPIHQNRLYLAFDKKMAMVSINGIQPIGLMLFPDDVDFLYDPELHSLPDYWQPHR